MNRIERFRGHYAFLSNFYPALVTHRATLFVTAEHAYQAAKAATAAQREAIRKAHGPAEAKRLGKKLDSPGWHEHKLQVMHEVLESKFSLNPDLRRKLLATGDSELIEGNTWGDTFWGVCDGIGENFLGVLLMQVRADIRTKQLYKSVALP